MENVFGIVFGFIVIGFLSVILLLGRITKDIENIKELLEYEKDEKDTI